MNKVHSQLWSKRIIPLYRIMGPVKLIGIERHFDSGHVKPHVTTIKFKKLAWWMPEDLLQSPEQIQCHGLRPESQSLSTHVR
jgi:hypothetical protein